MYKNNSRDSSKFRGCSPLQLSYNLTGKLPQSAIILILTVMHLCDNDEVHKKHKYADNIYVKSLRIIILDRFSENENNI